VERAVGSGEVKGAGRVEGKHIVDGEGGGLGGAR
jgi:hypothetical protein